VDTHLAVTLAAVVVAAAIVITEKHLLEDLADRKSFCVCIVKIFSNH